MNLKADHLIRTGPRSLLPHQRVVLLAVAFTTCVSHSDFELWFQVTFYPVGHLWRVQVGHSWRAVKRVYCQRGDIENRIKELHDLEIDRTSCTSFWANQFRVLLTAAAYVQEVRLRAAGTACARAQVHGLRERLLKLGGRVMVSVRRLVIHLPESFPFLPAFRLIAFRLGAQNG